MTANKHFKPGDRRHSLIVFRGMPQPGVTPLQVADRVKDSLEAAGFGDFRITGTQVAGQPAAQLDCAKHDAGRVWAVRQYIVIHGTDRLVLGCGSSMPEEDDELFTAMAERFEILAVSA